MIEGQTPFAKYKWWSRDYGDAASCARPNAANRAFARREDECGIISNKEKD